MSDPTFWIEARASGLAAYIALTASVLAGLTLKGKTLGTAVRPAAVTDVHRVLALLALGLTALHGATLVLDATVHITVLDLLVPGTLPYRPLWTGLGVVAAEVLLLIYASFSQRKRIGARNWRRLHWLAYGVFAAMTAHGVMAGTDTQRPYAIAVYGASVGLVAGATLFRALGAPRSGGRRVVRPRAEAPTG